MAYIQKKKKIVTDSDILAEIMCSNCASSEFKNQFIYQMIEDISLEYMNTFISKFPCNFPAFYSKITRNLDLNIAHRYEFPMKERTTNIILTESAKDCI